MEALNRHSDYYFCKMVSKKSETTISEQKLILKLVCEGKSYRETAKIVGRSLCAVEYVINKFKNEGILQKKPGEGENVFSKEEIDNLLLGKLRLIPKKVSQN